MNDKGAIAAVWILLSFLDDCLDLLEGEAHLDPIATVAVLSWLDNPSIVLLYMPFFLTCFGDFLGPFVIVLDELKVLLVLKSILDVEGKRKITEDIFLDIFVIVGHRIEESLLIPQDVVIDEMIMHFLFVYLADFHNLAILEVLPS